MDRLRHNPNSKKYLFRSISRFFLILIIFLVNKLKQETDVMINIPDTDRSQSTSIRIEGNKDGVKRAKEVNLEIYFIFSNWQF